MKAAVLALVAVISAAVATAGELGIRCEGTHPLATEIRYYVDGQQEPIAVGAPGENVVMTGVPDGCAVRNYSCTQVAMSNGIEAESARSPVTPSAARPVIMSVLLTSGGLRQIIGDNFTAGSIVSIDGSDVGLPTTLQSCQLAEIDSVPFLVLELKTGSGLSVEYTLPLPAPQAPVVG